MCNNGLADKFGYVVKETPTEVDRCKVFWYTETDCDFTLFLEDWPWDPELKCDKSFSVSYTGGWIGRYIWWEACGCGYCVSDSFLVKEGFEIQFVVCPGTTTLECCPEGRGEDGTFLCSECQPTSTSTTSIISTTTTVPITTTSTSTTQPIITTTTPITTTTTIPPTPETFSISGHVTGDIFIIASITLSGKASKTVYTDDSGYYEFSDLESGYYTITPSKEGFSFEPPYHMVQNLTSNLYDMNFVSTRIPPAPCTAEAIYSEDSEEVELLRYLRDEVLSKTPEGQGIIKLYYQWSPVIVKVMEEDEDFKGDVKEMIDEILMLVEEEAE